MTLPTTQKLEIEWTSPTFTDVTTWLEQRFPVEAHYGRMTATGDVESASLTFTLDNRDGRFTPANPAGEYWPEVVKGKRVRWKVTGGDGVERTEFVGYIQGFEPGFADGGVSGSIVTVTASDRYATSTRPFLDNAVEAQRYEARTLGCDIWAFTDRQSATELRNDGVKTSQVPGLVVNPARTTSATTVEGGTLTLGVPDGGLACSGMVSFQPSNGVGPVVLLEVTRSTFTARNESVQMWHRTTEVPTTYTILARGYDTTPDLLWELRLVNNAGQTDLELWSASGAYDGTVAYAVNDGMWRHIWLKDDGASTDTWVAGLDQQVATYTSLGLFGESFRLTTWVTVGGGMAPNGRGRQHHCTTSDVAQVMVSKKTVFGYASSSSPLQPRNVSDRVADYSRGGFGSSVITVTGATDRGVGIPDVPGATITQVLQEMARTVGGVAWVKPDGTAEFRQPDQCRPTTPLLTVDVEADAEGSLALASSVDTSPTRTTVTSPAGDITVVAADEGTVVVEDQIDTCAATITQARAAGELRLASQGVIRVPQVTLNLATTTTDLWDETYALYPTARVRLTGLPSTVLGWSHADFYVSGWTKRAVASEDGATDGFWVDLDLEPAWTVAETGTARVAAGAGAMTATAGTITGTGTGTLVVTTVSGPTLSTDAGDYPQDFDWWGERVTVTSPPVGAVSPQTVTVTVRGVAPSVARTHGAGEAFDVWTPGSVGI